MLGIITGDVSFAIHLSTSRLAKKVSGTCACQGSGGLCDCSHAKAEPVRSFSLDMHPCCGVGGSVVVLVVVSRFVVVVVLVVVVVVLVCDLLLAVCVALPQLLIHHLLDLWRKYNTYQT